MGLDMYLIGDEFVPSWRENNRPKRGGYEVTSYRLDLGYWRKHGPLHCHITNTYTPGVDDCKEIPLDSDELRSIADALRNNDLPADENCHGFFFGSPEMWAEDRAAGAEHAAIFDRAAAWLDEDRDDVWRSVFYQASW